MCEVNKELIVKLSQEFPSEFYYDDSCSEIDNLTKLIHEFGLDRYIEGCHDSNVG